MHWIAQTRRGTVTERKVTILRHLLFRTGAYSFLTFFRGINSIVKNFFMKVWHYYFAARYFIYAIEWAAARS